MHRGFARDITNCILLEVGHLGGHGRKKWCSVIGCSNCGGHDRGVSFYRIPAVLEHQGEKK